MAKYSITHRCGHTATHQITGPVRNRDYQINRLKSEDCSECERAEWLRQREAENAAAAERAQAEGLPALQGTEKQIPWAESIRRDALDILREHDPRVEASITKGLQSGEITEMQAQAARDAAIAYRADLIAQTDARWWIDHRNTLQSEWNLARARMDRVRHAVRVTAPAPDAQS